MTTRHARLGQRGVDVSRPPGGAGRRLDAIDSAALLWRELPFMLVAWALLMLAALACAALLRPGYEARARLLLPANAPSLQAAGAEIAILTSRPVAEEAFQALRSDPAAPPHPAAFRHGFSATATPDGAALMAAFRHDDAAFSARALEAFLTAYMNQRAQAVSGSAGADLAAQREALMARLAQTDADLVALLARHGVFDVESERAVLQALLEADRRALAATHADLRAAQARRAQLSRQRAATATETAQPVETSAQRHLRALEREREELLARYTPESETVRLLDERIAGARALLDRPDGAEAGQRPTGPSALWSGLALDHARAEAEAAALDARAAAIRASLGQTEGALARLRTLAAAEGALIREKASLEEALHVLAAQAEAARAAARPLQVIEPPGRRGDPAALGAPWLAAAGGLAGGLALLLGLVRGLSRRGFPTAACAARTVGLPVLAAIR